MARTPTLGFGKRFAYLRNPPQPNGGPIVFFPLRWHAMARILLIDDDPDVRTMMNVFLKKEGYEVALASNREEALLELKQQKPGVILLDVLLSGFDGRQLCREIKSSPENKGIRVIMFSGHPTAAHAPETYGADDFIAKPLNTDLLLRKLKMPAAEMK